VAALFANSKRDPKKQQKPLSYLDFSFYRPRDDGETPSGANGSAYMELVKTKKLPPWALFCFKELSASAIDGYVPDTVAFIAEDAILLAPSKEGKGYRGLLIAMESAGDQRRSFRSTGGEELILHVPYLETKFEARENEFLSL